MPWQIEVLLYLLLLGAALVALQARDLLAAAVTTSVFSFVIAILYVGMGAVDVGFTEAVVGAGVVGIYFIVVVLRTTRRSKD